MDNRGLLDLVISRIPGLSTRDKLLLSRKFDQEEKLYILSRGDLEELLGRVFRPGESFSWERIRILAEQDAVSARNRGIFWVSAAESRYPPQLRESWDPPALLDCMGELPDPEKPLAAVVGTRRPSGAAAAQAYSIGRELASGGVSVVSGLALGIDAMAHRGNLEGGGRTVAVLGSGIDCVYPSSNRPLARRILENDGLLLSEYPPGTEPFKWNFPARNRIIAALARGTVVVEAPAKSGALITARLALEQDRDLWVASAGAVSPLGEGTARLVEDGAPVIRSGFDVLEEWGIQGGEERELVTNSVTALAAVDEPPGAALGAALGRELGRTLGIGI
jgi:DNA processing protein